MKTASIIGHRRVLKFLEHVLQNDQVSHAYLFYGPEKVGKGSVAKVFARQIAGEDKMAERRVSIVRPEGSLKIGEIRSLQHELSLTNPYGNKRVVVLGDIDKMTREAQNAFLKLLEEPQTQVVFILLAKKLKSILPTIISRAQLVRFSVVPTQEIKKALQGRGKDPSDADQVARLAGGRPGLAFTFVDNEQEYNEIKKQAKVFLSLIQAGTVERFRIARNISSEEKPEAMLDIWEGVLRDLLVLPLQKETLTHYELLTELEVASRKISISKTVKALRGLAELQNYFHKNLNTKLVLENFMLSYLPS